MNFDSRGYGGTSGEGQRSRRGRGQARGSQRSARFPDSASRESQGNAYRDRAAHGHHVTRDYGERGDVHNVYESNGNELAGTVAAEHLEARDLSSVTKMLMRMSKMEHASARSDPKLRDVLTRLYSQLHASDLSIWPRELSDIAFALGKLQMNDTVVVELLKRIAEIAKYQADQFTPHDMACIVFGFASLGVRNESLMSVIAAEVVNKIQGFDQRQLSNTAWAFAKCGLWNEQLVSAIAAECLVKISTFTVQSLSHISWAMAQWGTRKDDLMNAIAEESQRKASEFAPAPLAMTAWSFASLQLKSVSLMSSISAEAAGKIALFKTQDLAHLAWAFANLRVQDQALFLVIAGEVQRNVNGMLPSELANIAWAFSKNNFTNESLMNCIAGEAVVQISNFKSAEVAMLTWAFAVAGMQNKPLMTEIGVQVAKRIDRFSAPQLSHIAWAFGALSLRHGELLQSLSTHVHNSIRVYKAQGLSNIAWAFAMVTFRDEELLLRVAPEIARDVAELRPLALARCAWAYRVLAVQSSELALAISSEALKKVDDFPTKALVKLIDSAYIGPAAKEHFLLEKALAQRTEQVSNFLKSTWTANEPRPTPNVEEYTAQMLNFSVLDCGIVGTPLLLSQLEIELPSREFIRRCFAREWTKLAQESPQRGHKEFTVAEIKVTAMDKTLHDWVVRYVNDAADQESGGLRHGADGLREDMARWLVAVDLPGRNGRAETTYMVLSELCTRIFSLGVEPSSVDACKSVGGNVQLLSTVLPCVSSIGALHQFATRFPNIVLEFSEQKIVQGE